MITQQNINLATVIILAMGFIYLGGAFFYKHLAPPIHQRNPIYWALGIGLASGGGSVIIGLVLKNLLHSCILDEMKEIKSKKI